MVLGEQIHGFTLSQSKNRCVMGSAEALECCKEYGLAVESIG